MMVPSSYLPSVSLNHSLSLGWWFEIFCSTEDESSLAFRKPTLGQYEVIILPGVPLVNF